MKVIIKNSDLVFQRKHIPQVVYKDYWVRGSGQFISLSALGSSVMSLGFNNYKGILEVFIDTDTTNSYFVIMSSRGSYLRATNDGASLDFKNNGVGAGINNLSGAGDHTIEFDNKVGSVDIDGTINTFTPPSSSTADYIWLFASGNNDGNASAAAYSAGRFKFKRLRLYNATTDALLCDIRPATIDGVPCLLDDVSETKLFSADGTDLVLE